MPAGMGLAGRSFGGADGGERSAVLGAAGIGWRSNGFEVEESRIIFQIGPAAWSGRRCGRRNAFGSAAGLSSPFPGKVSRPESGHSFRLPVCCLAEIDGRPRIRLRAELDISEPDAEWFCCIGTALAEAEGGKVWDISCRTSKVAGFSAAFCWTAGPPDRRTADRQT